MNKIEIVNNLKYADIKVGEIHEYEKKISKECVMAFAKLTGDYNPLHVDEEFGKNSKFGKNIVQGMLAGSLFSTLVGMHCPGKNCLYLKQSLNFRNPLFYEDNIKVKGTVTNKNDTTKMLTLKTEIIKEDKVMINGEAKVIVNE